MITKFLGKKHSIARRLLFLVIVMSTAMTILTSSYQLYGSYHRYLDQLNVRFTEIERIHVKLLSSLLWTSDSNSIEDSLDEISILPDIIFMEVKEQNKLIAKIGIEKRNNVITKNFPMLYQYKGKTIQIGSLKVQATLDNVYGQTIDQIFDILISNAIKTFFLAGFILFIFNQLITRHLEKMSYFASKLNITNLQKSLTLDRPHRPNKENDELDILVQALESMQHNLFSSIEVMKKSEQKFKQLVGSTTAIPWELDLSNWLFTYVGEQAVTVLGYPTTDWYEKDFWNTHIHPDDLKYATDFCSESTKAGLDHSFEYRMISAKGKTIWIRDDVKIIYKNNEPSYLQGYMFDITEKKLTELELEEHRGNLEKLVEQRTIELQSSNNELEAFSYSVSHDLRAPLRGIDGFSQILIEDNLDSLDETSLEYLHRIRKAAQLMGQIINDLLLLSRVTRQELNTSTINISKLCHDSIVRLKEKDTRNITVEIKDNLETQADEHLVPTVIENLLGNAWKYTSKNDQAKIEVGSTQKNDKLFFYVKDNGIGFNMDFINKIFLPFQRLHSANDYQGTGIGLATTARVILRHGGEIIAEAKEGEGATFYFRFS